MRQDYPHYKIRRRKRCTFLAHLLVLVLLFLASQDARATSRALVVGISNYDRMTTGWATIHGANDVDLLLPRLKKNGFTDIATLTDKKATKKNIVGALQTLARRSRPGDKIYFHFSGHGQPVRDDNGDEGKGKGFDESIVPYDACRDNLKMNGTYNGQNHLIDDELSLLLDDIKKKLGPEGELMVVVDACYSRGIQKDESTDVDPELMRYVRGTDIPFMPRGTISTPYPKNFTPGARMYVITACDSNERNIEYRSPTGKIYGSLSYYIYTLLKTDADFTRWSECFRDKKYLNTGIFQSSQHPSVKVFD